MKKIFYTVLFTASTAMGLSACMNGDYDANPLGTASGTNPLNTGGTGTGGGGSNSNSFNWSGTDPLSAKIDGTAWKATDATYDPSFAGFPATVSGGGPNNSAILLNIPDNAAVNSITNFNTIVSATWSANTASGNPNDVYAASLGGGGAVQILENDATHIKGKFYFNAKNTAGTAVNISEGYFNATK